MNIKEKRRTVSAALVASLLFIQCAVAVDEPPEVTPNRASIAEITEIISLIEESALTAYREVMELQKLFDISPEAQEAFLKTKILGAPLYYSYTSESEFIWSTRGGGFYVPNRLSNIQGSHNARKRYYLEQLVAADDRLEILDSEPSIKPDSTLVIRGVWSASIYDDKALFESLLLLAQMTRIEEERGIVNYSF